MNQIRPVSRIASLARELRKNPTPAEKLLWRELRGRNFRGLKFRRQHPIGSFIVDFACLSRQLVVEVDGGIHLEPGKMKADRERRDWLRSKGFVVVRVTNSDVMPFVEIALSKIERFI